MLTTITSRREANPKTLTDLLLACHERIRQHLSLARAVGERGGAPRDQVIDACQRVERYFTEALPLHVMDEDESIAPRLRGRSSDVDRALAELEAQHRAHDRAITSLIDAARAVRLAPSEARLRSALAKQAHSLEAEMRDHLLLEETVVFPALRALLSEEPEGPALEEQLLGELRARRLEVTPLGPR